MDKQRVLLIIFLEHLAEHYGTLETWSPRNIIPCLVDWPKQLLMPARPSETLPIAEALWSKYLSRFLLQYTSLPVTTWEEAGGLRQMAEGRARRVHEQLVVVVIAACIDHG